MPQSPSHNQKSHTRFFTWNLLSPLTLPDSRFHDDYTSFIPSFHGSSLATSLLTSLPIYQSSSTIFIAPDDCLQELRHQALKDGKVVLVTSYRIKSEFWLLDLAVIERSRWEVASLLDEMELVGEYVSLAEMRARFGKEGIGLIVTGAGAVNYEGMKFGKGLGYFDLEYAMLCGSKKTAALVHECQILDEKLKGDEWDVGCDFLVTSQSIIEVLRAEKPTCGMLWENLGEGMEADIEPLKELRDMQRGHGEARTQVKALIGKTQDEQWIQYNIVVYTLRTTPELLVHIVRALPFYTRFHIIAISREKYNEIDCTRGVHFWSGDTQFLSIRVTARAHPRSFSLAPPMAS